MPRAGKTRDAISRQSPLCDDAYVEPDSARKHLRRDTTSRRAAHKLLIDVTDQPNWKARPCWWRRLS